MLFALKERQPLSINTFWEDRYEGHDRSQYILVASRSVVWLRMVEYKYIYHTSRHPFVQIYIYHHNAIHLSRIYVFHYFLYQHCFSTIVVVNTHTHTHTHTLAHILAHTLGHTHTHISNLFINIFPSKSVKIWTTFALLICTEIFRKGSEIPILISLVVTEATKSLM